MEKETIGLISGIIVILSVIPYGIRTYQGKVHPNPTSWVLWAMIGLALLLTYKSSGADANVWPAVFGFTNPLLITIFLVKNREKWKRFERFEIICFILGFLSLAMWWWMQGDKELIQYALYIAIAADACAAVPTIAFVWRFPLEDRPFAWALFAVGYGLAIFAISDHTIANYILPLYMFLGSFTITVPMVLRRLENSIPLKEWI